MEQIWNNIGIVISVIFSGEDVIQTPKDSIGFRVQINTRYNKNENITP